MVKALIPRWLAKAQKLPETIECSVIGETERALQLMVDGSIFWAPRAVVTLQGEYKKTPRFLLTVGDARIYLKVPHNEKRMDSIMGALWSKKNRIWMLPRSIQVVAICKATFGDDLECVGTEALEVHLNYTPIEGLYPFQELGANFLALTGHLLVDEMGLGKTVQAIAACRILGAKNVLVICPNSLKRNWAREIEKWAPGSVVSVVSGTLDERKKLLTQPSDYTILNPEILRLHSEPVEDKSGKVIRVDLHKELAQSWGAVIIDEAHRFKNRKAAMTMGARALRKYTDKVLELTGTPIMNRASELWTLLNIIDPKQYRSFWKFAAAFCNVYEEYGYTIQDITDPEDPKVIALRQHLTSVMLRRTKAEVFKDMPAKTIQKMWVPLNGEQEKIYHQMAEDMFAEKDGETVTADIPLAKITRLKQICIDPNLVFSPDEIEPLKGVKADVLKDIIEGLGDDKVVVFSQFSNAIYRVAALLDRMEIPYRVLTGDVKEKDRQTAIDDFQNLAPIKVFLATIAAGGVGITLTAASTAVFLDKDWNPSINLQAQDRLHRIGQTQPVTIIEILVEGSVEESIEELLDYKQEVIDVTVKGKNAPTHLISMHDLIRKIREAEGL